MKQTLPILILLVVAIASCNGRKTAKSDSPLDTLPMLVMQVQKCSRLYTSEYDIHKIVTHNDDVRLKGNVFGANIDMKMPLGNRSIAIPINAKVKAFVDFSQFSERNIVKQGKKITIILPDPQAMLTSSKVEQENIKQYVSLPRRRFSDAEITDFERQGRDAIVKTIPQLPIADNARDNAARILIPMIASLGYEESDITVSFRRDFRPDDIHIVTDKSTIER